MIKSIWDYLETVKGVSGATITGEGKVVLILDTSELVQNAQVWHNLVSPPDTRSARQGVAAEYGCSRKIDEQVSARSEEVCPH